MDWHSYHSQTFTDYLDDLTFHPRPAKAFRVQPETVTGSSKIPRVRCTSHDIPDEPAMQRFIQECRHESQKSRSWPEWTLTVLMLQRGPPNRFEEAGQSSVDQLWTLGCTSQHFEDLATYCGVNKSLPDCLMSHHSHYSRHHTHGSAAKYSHTSFNMRSSLSIVRDRAISSTSQVDKPNTFVLITGCTTQDFELFEGWLDTMKEYAGHPMLTLALFFELCCQYAACRYRELSLKFTTRYVSIFREGASLDLRRKAEHYRNEIEIANDLEENLDALDAELTAFNLCMPDINKAFDFISEKAPPDQADYLQEYGERLQDHMSHLTREYECLHTKTSKVRSNRDSLVTSLWGILSTNDNQLSRQISVASKRDSSIMIGITVGTLTFLPGTAMATIFAMPLFEWNTPSGVPSVHGSGLRIYLAVTLPLTAAAIFLLLFWVTRIDSKTGERKSTVESIKKWTSGFVSLTRWRSPSPTSTTANANAGAGTTATVPTDPVTSISVAPGKTAQNTSPPGP